MEALLLFHALRRPLHLPPTHLFPHLLALTGLPPQPSRTRSTNWHWRYHSLSSTRAGRLHDSGDSSAKKCQERRSGTPSADGSTLALMSSLSAPASGAPCGTGIIRMADEKVFSSKRAGKGGQEHKVELTVSPCPWRVTTQQEGTSIKIN